MVAKVAKKVNDACQPAATAGTDAIYRSLFDSFNPDSNDRISPLEVLSRLERCGLAVDDPRISEALTGLAGGDGGSRQISFAQFKALARHDSSLIRRAVEGNLAVPDFAALIADITRMHDELLPVRSGAVADYIPQLKRVDPDQLAIAVCTVDGQRFTVGDAATAFCLQSVSKTVSYCLALEEHGTDAVHQHMGREPSGRSFNELALNPRGLPHNPMVNAGVCPLTEDPVFAPGTVQSCLSLMSSCGMYDFSGEFAFTIGLPAKGGVSGAVMLVIPGLMGICVWSPRLDEHGNSVRGIEFCRKLVAAYNVHVFDSLVTGQGRTAKRDPAAEEEPDPDRGRGRADLGGEPGRPE